MTADRNFAVSAVRTLWRRLLALSLRPVDGARVFTVQWSISVLWWAETGSSDGGVEVGIEAILLEWVGVQDKVHAVYRVNLYVLLPHVSRALYAV